MASDLKFALNQFWKAPGFTITAVISLALGIGACTAVFSIANAILLRSLAVPNPQELRVIQWTGIDSQVPSLAEHATEDGNRSTAYSFTYPMFLSLREQASNIADIFGFIPVDDVAVRIGNEVFTDNGQMVSDNFFSGLGVRPFLGNFFSQKDEYAASASQVVVTFEFWEQHFSSDPDVLGKTVELNGGASTVVAVLPRAFDGIRPGDRRGFYVPMSSRPQFFKEPFQTFSSTRHWWVRLMARLRTPASDAQLNAVLGAVFIRDASTFMKEPHILVGQGRNGPSIDRDNYRKPLVLMIGIVALVMLAACANLAGLSLARGVARHHELSVRAALGAGRWTLIRLSLVESFLLAAAGGGLGIMFSIWIRDSISQLLADSTEGLHYGLSLNLAVLGFALAVTLATAILTGIMPALRASRVDPLDGLKAQGTLSTRRLRMGRFLVCAQMSLSMLILAGAALYVRSLANLRKIDPGFPTERLLTFQVNPTAVGYAGSGLDVLYGQIQDSLRAVPGVQDASFIQYPLLYNQSWDGGFQLSDGAAANAGALETHRLTVGEDFFGTLGIPILQGRSIRVSDDAKSAKIIVVNEKFARQYFAKEDPVGRQIRMLGADWLIVGICRDIKYDNIKAAIPATVYLSFRQWSVGHTVCFTLRTSGSISTVAGSIRRAVASIDPSIPVTQISSQDSLKDSNVNQERLLATLCGALAGLVLFLSCIGLFGLMAFNVAQRTKEIAVRIALGARSSEVAGMIFREAMLLAAGGIALGLSAILEISPVIQSQLYGVGPNDPATLSAAVVIFSLVTLLSVVLPILRATRVDPMVAMRSA